MAELHIERKDRSAWPWVLAGLLLLALVLWFLFGRADTADTVATTDSAFVTDTTGYAAAATTAGGAVPAAVTEYATFVTPPSGAEAGLDHNYTAEGLRRLAGALDAVIAQRAVSGVNVANNVSAIRGLADSIQADPTSTAHARQTREAALLASGAMRQVQQAGYAALDAQVRDVESAAESIRATGMLTDLTTEVRRFFEQSATALQAMARQE